jgi:hypothetical protein
VLLYERQQLSVDSFVELRVWQAPQAVRGSVHTYKYSLACVVCGTCVLRYDNEAGTGDHKHVGRLQMPYAFTTPRPWLADFWNDVDQSGLS